MTLCALEAVCINAVDVFILVSGFFLVTSDKRTIGKPLNLLFMTMLFKLFSNLISSVIKGVIPSVGIMLTWLLPNNYFVIFYITLYLISPYINIIVQKLTKQQYQFLLMMVLLLFSIWNFVFDFVGRTTSVGSIPDICTICRYGADDGYNIVNFAFLYLIGGYLRLHGVSISRSKIVMLLLASIVAICGLMCLETWLTGGFALGTALSYHSPFVIMSATFTFLLFNGLSINSKVINSLSKAAFTCFLIQGMFFSRLDIPRYVGSSIWLMVLHLLASIVIIYIAAYCVNYVYNVIFGKLFAKLDKNRIPYFE